MWNWMFLSSMIIAGGKWRCNINTMDVMDPSPRHIQLWPHMRASAAFSKGASGLRALRLVARSAGSSTFWVLQSVENWSALDFHTSCVYTPLFFEHHVISMLATVCTRPPDKFSWTLLKGRTVICEILKEHIPQWTNRPQPAQLDCWSQSLSGQPMILIASTGWGKMTAFFVPILILQHLVNHPKPQIPQPPSSPVALVVTPLIELRNAHVSNLAGAKASTSWLW